MERSEISNKSEQKTFKWKKDSKVSDNIHKKRLFQESGNKIVGYERIFRPSNVSSDKQKISYFAPSTEDPPLKLARNITERKLHDIPSIIEESYPELKHESKKLNIKSTSIDKEPQYDINEATAHENKLNSNKTFKKVSSKLKNSQSVKKTPNFNQMFRRKNSVEKLGNINNELSLIQNKVEYSIISPYHELMTKKASDDSGLNFKKVNQSKSQINQAKSSEKEIRILKKRFSFTKELMMKFTNDEEIKKDFPDLKIIKDIAWSEHIFIQVEGNSEDVQNFSRKIEKEYPQDEGIWTNLQFNESLDELSKNSSRIIENAFRNAEDQVEFQDENNRKNLVVFKGQNHPHLRFLENKEFKIKRSSTNLVNHSLSQFSENCLPAPINQNFNIPSSNSVIKLPTHLVAPESNFINNQNICLYVKQNKYKIQPPPATSPEKKISNEFKKINQRQQYKITPPPNPSYEQPVKEVNDELNKCIYIHSKDN